MQLKRLEAYGFKSFADKTEIEFDRGITAIVGPNGSGKSNITDAIRWALGEQNIRNLRGIKAEDVIFTGSADRKALGLAEVSLVFDNTGELPVDFREVTVTRRLFRSGESEFFINLAKCRLKDIYNLFADTGIGHEGMSIIGQNRIDDILNSKPEDRRAFFEETAGITKYKNRKKEALRKLEDTKNNLVRVNDIVQEIETHLEPLAASAAKTIKYNELSDEYKKCRLAELSLKHGKLSAEAAANGEKLTAAKDGEAAAEALVNTAEAKREELMKTAVDLEHDMREQTEKIDALRKNIETAGAEIAMLKEREAQSGAAKKKILERRAELKEKIAVSAKEIERLAAERATDDDELKKAAELLEREKNNAAAINEKITAGKNSVQTAEEKIAALQKSLTENEKESALVDRDIEADSEGSSKRNEELVAANGELTRLAEEETALRERAAAAKRDEETLTTAKADAEKKIGDIGALLNECSREENKFAQLTQQNKSKLQFLQRMQESYEGFGRATKAVLKKDAAWKDGIAGAVAEIITVPAEYVVAIEIALGGNLQNIVTKDADTAKAAIAFLKAEKLGRVTFLPLDTLTVKKADRNKFLNDDGFVGIAGELTETRAEYRAAVDFLLGRTIVVDNLDNALKMAKAHNRTLRIVTLEGELISPGGSIAGGSARGRETSFLGRSDEMASLAKKIAADEKRTAELKEKRLQYERELETAKASGAAVGEKLQAVGVSRAELRVQLENTAAAIKTQTERLAELKAQGEREKQSFARLKNKRAELSRAKSSVERELKAAKEEYENATNDVADLVEDADALDEYIRSCEIKRAVLEEKAQHTAQNIAMYEETAREDEESLRQNEREEDELRQSLEYAKTRLAELTADNDKWQSALDEGQNEYKNFYSLRMEKLAESEAQEKAVREANRQKNAAQEEVHRLELVASKLSFGLDECEEAMLSEFGVTPDRAAQIAPDIPENEIAKKIRELSSAINELGAVNPNAVTEYEEQKDRHEFMTKQASDLEEAKENLLKIISDMDETMTRQFKEAFKKIQEYFNEIFVRLFGGGRADLRLLDEDDVLNTGVEILVQLPQKKRQNLSALSGGERTLTVIALLFAFLKYRPSPFSVLDEIDAPLDEANVLRFGAFLKEFSANTQFIVVTHRKGTMEAVDTMYGVTVEDAGVSKIISVKLDDFDFAEN